MAKANFISKNKKPILIAGGAIIGLALVFLLLKNRKKNSPENADAPDPKITKVSWPLKRKLGALTTPEEQEVIKQIQTHLNRKISYVDEPLVVDGYFGPKTEYQLQLFYGVKEVSYKLYQEIMYGKTIV